MTISLTDSNLSSPDDNLGDAPRVAGAAINANNALIQTAINYGNFKIVSGTTYTVLAEDTGTTLVFTNAAAIAVTLPDGLALNFDFTVIQAGAGVPTVTPVTDTINGAGTGISPSAQWKGVYFAQYASTTWLALG